MEEKGMYVGGYITMYAIAIFFNAIPAPLVPYMDAITGLIIIATFPFMPWYPLTILALASIVNDIVVYILDFLDRLYRFTRKVRYEYFGR